MCLVHIPVSHVYKHFYGLGVYIISADADSTKTYQKSAALPKT